MAVTITEHHCQRVRCTDCGQTSTALLPDEVALSAFGPRLQAAIVTLSVRNRISRRDVVELCEQLFASRISTGTIDAILTRAGDALAEPYADLLGRVRGADALNIDETGWRLKGAQRALWGAFSEQHAVFAIAPSRHEDHARDLLADTTAIVTSDRWWAYGRSSAARSAGHICSATSPRTPTGSPPRRNSVSTGCGSAKSCSGRTSTPASARSSSAAPASCAAN